MTSTLMLEGNRVRVNTTIPKTLDDDFRRFVQEKYGIYRKGMMAKVLEESLREYIESEKHE
jgi:hypothetical protein